MAEDRLQAADFDHVGLARRLLRLTRHGTLGTVETGGGPFASLVALATDNDGAPVIITSHLSGHTRHLVADERASLLLADIGRGDPLAHPRLTLTGRARAAHPGEPLYEHLRGRYIARNPKAELYVQLPGFWFWRIEPEAIHLNGGFGKAWSGPWAEIATDLGGAEELLAIEGEAMAHLNTDHADTVRLYATALCGMPDGPWRAIGLDPEGLDMAAGDRLARLPFPRRITAGGALRLVMKELADTARAPSGGV
jgi:hypothetical protein